MQINSDYRDLLLRFNETAESFCTNDTDLWADPTPEKAIKVFNAELQKAIDVVDWGKVKLLRQCC